MDAASSPSSPSKLGHKLRTTVCCCFGGGSGSYGGAGSNAATERVRWRRRGAAAGEFRYDALSYALNFDEGEGDGACADDPAAAFRYRNFNARLPPSPPASAASRPHHQRATAIAIATEGEFSAGHPEGAVNIPYMNKTGSGMTKNTHFLEQVSRIFGKDDEIIVGCQSGKRSLMAATELCSAGFTAVTDIAGGFSSWRENGLPIIQ